MKAIEALFNDNKITQRIWLLPVLEYVAPQSPPLLSQP